MDVKQKIGEAFIRLYQTMARLRGPEGCPWDRAQTPDDLRNYILEEAYELIDAIRDRKPDVIRDELGDLLLQVVFLSRIYEEQGHFHLGDVAEHLEQKLIRRHPHVFGDETAETPEEVLQNWEERKARERGETSLTSRLLNRPHHLPALAEAWVIQRKAAQYGFDWPDIEGTLDKVFEEMEELKSSVHQEDRIRIEEELGDLLFSIVNIARKLNINPEIVLKQMNKKFVERFAYIERALQEQNLKFEQVDLETLDQLWEKAKKEL